MTELAKELGVYNDRIDTGPDGWAVAMSMSIVTFGVALGIKQAGMIEAQTVLYVTGVSFLLAALFLFRK